MVQVERNPQRFGSHGACVEPKGKRSSQKPRRLRQTVTRPRETQRTEDHSEETAAMGRQAAHQTRARTNHGPPRAKCNKWNGTLNGWDYTGRVSNSKGKGVAKRPADSRRLEDVCVKRNQAKSTLNSRQRWEGRQRLKPEQEPTTNPPKSQMEQMERNT